MKLTHQSDYALRLLMHLAANDGELHTIAAIAARYGISKNHLMKVALHLSRDGVIESVRGRSGGLRLARAPREIVIGAVVRSSEGDIALVECFQGDGGECLITKACRLKGVLKEALEAFYGVLDQYTLDDLVGRNPKLRLLLSEDAA